MFFLSFRSICEVSLLTSTMLGNGYIVLETLKQSNKQLNCMLLWRDLIAHVGKRSTELYTLYITRIYNILYQDI